MTDQLIPFGKYKNQPVAILANDKSYCDWLMGQDWMQARYPEIRTLIINNFGEPDETPEHNALQLKFFDEGLRAKIAQLALVALVAHDVVSVYGGQWLSAKTWFLASVGAPRFEHNAIDVLYTFNPWRLSWCPGNSGEPVGLSEWESDIAYSLLIECKPTLGDDYPAVLRTVLHQGRGIHVVVAERFTAQGGTLEQVQRLFMASGVHLVLLDDIEAAPLPTIVCEEPPVPTSEDDLLKVYGIRTAWQRV